MAGGNMELMSVRSAESGEFVIDRRLVNKSVREGQAQVVEGPVGDDKTPTLMIVVTGRADIDKFKRLASPFMKLFRDQELERG